MFHKTLQLYTICVFCIVCIRCISITSIVRIKCENWRIKPIQGCIGTFILPNVVLTTSYCAENCQYIGNERIVRSYIHPHYKNYVHGNNFIARNDIALVITPQDGKRRKLVKLSALDSMSTIAQKALIPIMDKDKPRLQVTLIERCYKEQPFGYYVCANNKVTQQTIQVCKERQEQGVPLLLEDRIFGIMGITDTDSCKLAQRSFTAIGPALYWISATVKKLGYTDDVITTLHDRTTRPVTQDTPKVTTEKPPPSPKTDQQPTPAPTHQPIPDSFSRPTTPKRTTEYTTPSFMGTQKIREEETSNSLRQLRKPFHLNNVIPLIKSSSHPSPQNKVRFATGGGPLMRVGSNAPSTSITKTTENPNAAITFIPLSKSSRQTSAVRTSRAITASLSTTKTRGEVTANTILPFFKLPGDNTTTNIMDWFKVNVKDKLKNNPSLFFVVSSSTSRRPIDFIDLT